MDNLTAKQRKEHEEWARVRFSPVKGIDFCKGMTNEELGVWMVPVRMAMGILTRTKKELVDIARKDFEGAKTQGSDELLSFIMIDQLKAAEEKFSGLAKLCGDAKLRVIVAAHAAT